MAWLLKLLVTDSNTYFNIDSNNSADDTTGIQVHENVERAQVASFANEANASQLDVEKLENSVSTVRIDNDPTINDVKAFLARPHRKWTGVISGSSVTNALELNIDSDFIETLILGRLKGALGIRATLCFRLQVATTPYSSGLLRMAWQPFVRDGDYDSDWVLTRQGPRYIEKPQRLQLPGVNLDLNLDTVAEMKIPWHHFMEFMPLQAVTDTNRAKLHYGVLSVRNYLNYIAPEGSSDLPASLWVWLEDVEVVGATSAMFDDDLVALSYGPVAQSGFNDEEQGLVSRPLYYGSKAVDMIRKGVPSLSSYLASTSWMLRASSKAAAAFGWSKPTNLKPIERNLITDNVYQFNCDAADTSNSLGLFANNQLAASSTFSGSNEDEMCLASFLSHPGLIALGQWTAANTGTVGATLYQVPVCPMAMYYRTYLSGTDNPSRPLSIYASKPDSNVNVYTTPVFTAGTVFNLWKGSMKFKVRIGKTRSHASPK